MTSSCSRLLISFSGGETSALMAKLLLENNRNSYNEIVVIFANTGQEHPRTLDFVNHVDREFNLNLVWVESVVHHGKRKSCSHKIVSYETASRDGSLFEEMVKKYGISNHAYPHCTRALKLDPITNYARSIGWAKGSYDTAIGIRVDEIDRMSIHAKRNRIIYPLIKDFPMRKMDVNAFWRSQPKRLEITGYQGNCVWCWKKTFRKHYTLIEDDRSWYDLPKRLEADYPLAGYNLDGTPRTFFRGNRSTKDILLEADKPFVRFDDENRKYDACIDVAGGCGESCEVY